MSIIGGTSQGGSGADAGDIGHSLRFRSNNSAYLFKAFAGGVGNTKGTFFCGIKRGRLGTLQNIFNVGSGGTDFTAIFFNAGTNSLHVTQYAASVLLWEVVTSPVFRDPTAHAFLTVGIDSTQAVAADRVKIYLGGTRLPVSGTYPALNQNIYLFDGDGSVPHSIGRYPTNGNHFDGYLSRICGVHGVQLDPSSFIYLNTETNAWVTKSQAAVKAVVDGGGTNSFMLDFDDGTSLTTLGYDKSSKGNNWTLNNFSLTPGVSYDWMLDTPSNNFATLNPLEINAGLSAVTYAEGNLRAASTSGAVGRGASTIEIFKGKYYFEVTLSNAAGGTSNFIGVSTGVSGGGRYYMMDGTYWNGSGYSAYGSAYVSGDLIGCAIDMTGQTIEFFKNGVSQGQKTSIGLTSPVRAQGDSYIADGISFVYANFGQRPFAYTPPTGFKALCTANLLEATGAALNPKRHFDAIGYIGAGTTQDVNMPDVFSPEFVWLKCRNVAESSHYLYDRVRGATKSLTTNSTAAEQTIAQTLTSFNLNGFTLGTAGGNINGSGNSFVSWNWKAGGAHVTNTAGSITSQVSANVEAGFSIVTYTGTGANATVGHGLDRAPKMVIVKSRSQATTNWSVHHSAIGAANVLLLNVTGASVANGWMQNTAPTASVFSLGAIEDGYTQNRSTQTYVAYCFAEIPGYSKIGSYVGNGSADGPFVPCGFRPRWVILKEATGTNAGTSSWIMHDSERSPVNAVAARLAANQSNSEFSDGLVVDFLANGFKIRNTNQNWNEAGGTFIFMAIAETTFKYANAR